MKTLGILGGLGPQTTSKIYLSIIDLINKGGGEKYPPIVIYNLPFPFIIEHEAIVQGINSEKMIPYLIDGAKILQNSGVDFGILPCNTLHKYIEDIRSAVQFPFLSILEETTLILKEKKIKNVGILATETTIKSNIYGDLLKNDGIHILYPSDNEQIVINSMIVEVLNGTKNAIQEEKIQQIFKALQGRGAEVLLLACTDIQLIASGMVTSIPLIDTTEILINASIREMLKAL